MFLEKKGPIDVPGGLILLPMFAAHPYNHFFCTEYTPPGFHHTSGMLHHLLTLRNNSKCTSSSLNELGVLNCINTLHHDDVLFSCVQYVMHGLCDLHDPPASCCFKLLWYVRGYVVS